MNIIPYNDLPCKKNGQNKEAKRALELKCKGKLPVG
jgi:hypothetical protein